MKYQRGLDAKIIYGCLLFSLSVSALVSYSYFAMPVALSQSTQGSQPALKFNGKIAFSSDQNSVALDIFSINPDGSNRARLTNDIRPVPSQFGGTFDFSPAWSPDGTKLAFVSERDGARYQIYSMNADGSDVRKISDSTINDSEPAWSPDGSKIAFTRGGGCIILLNARKGAVANQNDDPCQPFVYTMNVDGSNRINLSQTPGSGPVWSPDGSKIAFSSYNTNFNSDIFIMNADGSNPQQLTNTAAHENVSSWSPDGTRLAFTSDRDAPANSFVGEIYTMKIDGTDIVRLTNNELQDYGPVFSPDGTKIAFQRGLTFDQTQAADIFVMNGDGSNQTNITNSSSQEFGPPSWQPLAAPAQVTPPAVLQFDATTYNVSESSTSFQINVLRSGNTVEAVSVKFGSVNGTASDISDYSQLFGRLQFAPGETSKSISLLINEDAFIEGTETLSISLRDLTGNSVLGNSGVATVSILDNDNVPPSTNPLDNSEFFVRQHYHDFLNREPDAEGLAFWVNNIESCGADAACREVKRIDTSAAFFLSTEFRNTGFYVFRLWLAGLQHIPDFSNFMRDTQEISRDLIVRAPGWEQLLEANTQRFTEEFVSRSSFRLLYPEDVPCDILVDILYLRSGVTPSGAERSQAIVACGIGDTAGRARTVRMVANNELFTQRLFTSGFVAEEYFGYLRRDFDFDGFLFWSTKLNQFNGDFRSAEMVKAFITSTEYRSRFGSP